VIPLDGGEPVAFHAMFIMSSGCTLIPDKNNLKPLPDYTSFKVFAMSGEFHHSRGRDTIYHQHHQRP